MTCHNCQADLPQRELIAGRCHACTAAALALAEAAMANASAVLQELNAAKRAEAERIARYREQLVRRVPEIHHHG